MLEVTRHWPGDQTAGVPYAYFIIASENMDPTAVIATLVATYPGCDVAQDTPRSVILRRGACTDRSWNHLTETDIEEHITGTRILAIHVLPEDSSPNRLAIRTSRELTARLQMRIAALGLMVQDTSPIDLAVHRYMIVPYVGNELPSISQIVAVIGQDLDSVDIPFDSIKLLS